MQIGMVILGIVGDDDHPAPGSRTGPVELPEEVPAGLRIEALTLAPVDESIIAQANGAEVTDALASWVVSDYRILNVGWNPHTAAGAILLKVHFIDRPEIDVVSTCQVAEFFYALIGARGPLWRSPGAALPRESPVAGTSVDTGVRRCQFSSDVQ